MNGIETLLTHLLTKQDIWAQDDSATSHDTAALYLCSKYFDIYVRLLGLDLIRRTTILEGLLYRVRKLRMMLTSLLCDLTTTTHDDVTRRRRRLAGTHDEARRRRKMTRR